MIEKVSNYILKRYIEDGEELSKDQRDVLLFGITRILEDIPKFVAILFICFLLNMLKELFIVFIVTVLYKTFIGGAHARTNFGCFIISTIYFTLPIILAKYINYNIYIFYSLLIVDIVFSAYVIIKLAPADTEEIPIINKIKREKFKLGATISAIILNILIIFFIKDILYTKLILYTILLINIFATKTMYKILKCKFGNELQKF